jgi:hypothetical protein
MAGLWSRSTGWRLPTRLCSPPRSSLPLDRSAPPELRSALSRMWTVGSPPVTGIEKLSTSFQRRGLLGPAISRRRCTARPRAARNGGPGEGGDDLDLDVHRLRSPFRITFMGRGRGPIISAQPGELGVAEARLAVLAVLAGEHRARTTSGRTGANA